MIFYYMASLKLKIKVSGFQFPPFFCHPPKSLVFLSPPPPPLPIFKFKCHPFFMPHRIFLCMKISKLRMVVIIKGFSCPDESKPPTSGAATRYWWVLFWGRRGAAFVCLYFRTNEILNRKKF